MRILLGVSLSAILMLGGCGGSSADSPVPEPPPLSLSGIEPRSGPITGGTWILLAGEGFAEASALEVRVGGASATDLLLLDDGQLWCRTPAGAGGRTDVVVRATGRESVLPGAFCYGAVFFLAGARDPFGTIHRAIYAGDVAGAEPRLVSMEMPAESHEGCLRCFQVSHNGHFLAYVADPDQPGFTELHVAVADGSVNLTVSGPVACNDGIGEYAWSPDDTRIAYRATAYGPDRWDLFTSSPYSELSCSRLTPAPVHADPDAGAPVWSPDGAWVAHAGDLDEEGVFELYVAAPDGSVKRKVSGPLTAGGDVDANSVVWSPDSLYLAYVADQDTDGVSELYVTTPGGATPVKVSGPLVPGGDVGTGLAWSWPAWAPDGSRLAYVADAEMNGVVELFVVAPDGTAHARLSTPMSSGGSVRAVAWAPTGSRVAYVADAETYGDRELYVVDAACGCGTKVSGTLIQDGRVDSFAWAPDGSSLAFCADPTGGGTWHVFTTPATEAAPVQVTTATAQRSRIGSYSWTPDASGICYTARDDLESQELYLAPAAGQGGVLRLSGPSVSGGGVRNAPPHWLAGGTHAVYAADPDEVGRFEIYVVRADGTERQSVTGSLPADGLEIHVAGTIEVR